MDDGPRNTRLRSFSSGAAGAKLVVSEVESIHAKLSDV
jgi:hypothetical protein